MTNGHVIAEIRAILAVDENIPPKVRDRLMLAAISELYTMMDRVTVMGDRLTAIENTHASEKKLQAERQAERQFYLRATSGAAIAAIVTLILNGIVWFFNILPALAKIGGQ